MDVKAMLFMNKGDGGNSYVQHAGVTQKVASMTKPALEETVRSILSDFHGKPVLNVADLGCASGPNTFSVMSTVISTVENISKELDHFQIIPEIQFYLNDLPGNDFNTLFHGLSRFGESNKGVPVPYSVVGAPGSFHGRLFPKNSMDLVHSSFCVHWLSKVPKLTSDQGAPLNEGKVTVSKTSPPIVREAYLAQFRDDFSLFLKSRSQEMVHNGRIILIIHGRNGADPASNESYYTWELLAKAITQMVSLGLIDEKELDSCNAPYYTPSSEEVRDLVDMEGSFEIERLEVFTVDNKSVWSVNGGGDEPEKIAEAGAKSTRSFTESVMAHHFGQYLMDELYGKFVKNIIVEDLSQGSPITTTSIMIVLKKMV